MLQVIEVEKVNEVPRWLVVLIIRSIKVLNVFPPIGISS